MVEALMLGLSNPDRRRALRSIIDAVVMLALVGAVYLIISSLKDGKDLVSIGHGALIILGLGTLFYGAENIVRAFKLTGPLGFSAEFGDDPASQAADTVAGAAVDAAAEVKGGAQ